MATRKITTEVTPRTVYTSPCGRVRVENHGRREYLALLDDQPLGFHEFAFQAEYAGHTALTEALELEQVQAADEAADRDAAAEQLGAEVAVEAVHEEVAGELLGTYFRAGGLDIFVASNPVNPADAEPTVFLSGRVDGLPLSVVERAIPLVLSILADPRFQTARAALPARVA